MRTYNTQTVKDLENYLYTAVRSSPNKPVAVIGGHYPLERDFKPGVTADDSFGYFPKYTMDLACRLVKAGKERGNNAKLALLVDDHSQHTPTDWYTDKGTRNPETERIRQNVENYFRTFKLPESYQTLLSKNGLTERDIVSSKHHPLVFQESKYREELPKQTGSVQRCAAETLSILEELAEKGFKKTIGLIPTRCEGPTCGAVGAYNKLRQTKPLPEMKVTFAYLASEAFPSSFDFRDDDVTPDGLIKRTVETRGGVGIATFG